jgi:predicted tellurium resistance membrane protein TerC
VIGLTVAICFMALLSAYIAKLLAQHPWISWIGLVIVLYVALEMIWSGGYQVGCAFVAPRDCEAGAFATFTALLSS